MTAVHEDSRIHLIAELDILVDPARHPRGLFGPLKTWKYKIQDGFHEMGKENLNADSPPLLIGPPGSPIGARQSASRSCPGRFGPVVPSRR
jgi:hypothetical protein